MMPTEPTLDLAAELESLRARLAEYEGAINWGTSCLSCASVLDASYEQWRRADQAERDTASLRAALDDARALAECSDGSVDVRELLAVLTPKGPTQRRPGARQRTTNVA